MFKPTGRGRETSGQRLAQTVAEVTDINNTTGTDHTKWEEPETFPRYIAPFAGDKKDGAMDAKKHTDRVGELFFWTDRLRWNCRGTEASVAWCNPD